MVVKFAGIIALLCVAQIRSEDIDGWSYKCMSGKCQKTRLTAADTAVSLGACHLLCDDYASIWPKPAGKISKSSSLVHLNINSIDVLLEDQNAEVKALVDEAGKRFKKNIELMGPKTGVKPGGKSLLVTLTLDDTKTKDVVYNGDEGYTLNIDISSDGRLLSAIHAKNFFGARNGLETLSQVVIYDDIRNEFQILEKLYVSDFPAYKHRGILLDTARNYISTDAIKRTIEGMAASKLNIFHWHITDSHSFPYVSSSLPKLSKLGAYTPSKVYTREDVNDIIEFARVRGVKVMPEFDAPAHVGEGWQDTGFVTCFDKKPWQTYCVEPPCGQFDPTQEGLYDALEKLFGDMVDQFNPDVFHMGGDEVSETCWQSDEKIVKWMQENGYSIDQAGFMKLWNKFQSEALNRFTKKRGRKIPIILWTSTLTGKDYLKQYLPNDTYIIQIWTTGTDKQIDLLFKEGYKVILSNYDALYFDCGFAGWVQGGNNWCSPYIGWQKVYENSPAQIAGSYKDQMMGAEATLWTEQVDDSAVDGRLWPRAAAMSERLWTEPSSSWKDAEDRMLIHRNRLVQLQIAADTLQPQWCSQHQGSCPVDGQFN